MTKLLLTGKSITEIRESLTNKTPFFEAEVNGNKGEENEDLILEILRFSNEPVFEISQEIFENQVRMKKILMARGIGGVYG